MEVGRHRMPELEAYYRSLDYSLDRDLNEKYHEVRYFDAFLDNIGDIIETHKDDVMFYTGWNYKPVKKIENHRFNKYGIC